MDDSTKRDSISNMHKYFILLFILGAFSASYAQKTTEYSDSGYSKIAITIDTVDGFQTFATTVTTQSYRVEYSENGSYLIDERSIQSSSNISEGEIGRIILAAKVSDKGNFDKLLWRDSIPANSIQYFYDYFQTISEGCCEAQDAKTLYRYSDGKPMMLMTTNVYQVTVPNTKTKRLIGFLSNNYASGYEGTVYEKYDNDSLLAGMLSYIDPATLDRQIILIHFKDKNLFDSIGMDMLDSIAFSPAEQIDKENLHKIGFYFDQELTLWSQDKNPDPKAVSGFSIDLFLAGDDKLTIRLPVVRDKIDISKVKSKWFTFSTVK
jgi:hypothetical protein